MPIAAVIDLGSNSVRMDIVKIYPGAQTELLYQTRKMVRLSEDMTEDMRLKVEPMWRTIEALKEFKRETERFEVEEIHAVATAGVRKAENQKFFVAEVLRETGIALRVISGRQEAIYDFLGVVGTLKIEHCLIVDTGGGSTELIYVKDGTVREAVSIPMGAVSLSEQFFRRGESEQARRTAAEFVREQLNQVEWLQECCRIPIVGLGGSIRTLAKVNIKLSEKDAAIHGYELSKARVSELCHIIESRSPEERKKMRGIDRERADIIGGGLLPLRCLTEELNTERVIVSDHGLRTGLLFECVGEQYKKMLDILENAEHN